MSFTTSMDCARQACLNDDGDVASVSAGKLAEREALTYSQRCSPKVSRPEAATTPKFAGALCPSYEPALRRHDHLADRPERDAGELEVRPGEGDADDGDCEHQRRQEMAEREPPAGEHEPDDVADHPERAGADILDTGDVVAVDRTRAEREQRVDCLLYTSPSPRDS